MSRRQTPTYFHHRLTTQIVDVALEEIEIGMKVKLEFRRFYAEGHDGIIEYGHKAVPVRR